jgi:four helix bundle protein
MEKRDLEERLINFAVMVVQIVETMNDSRAAGHLSGQLLRSGTSPALNYGEAQSGESRKDFIHKLKVVLKELRESFVCLQIVQRTKLNQSGDKVTKAISENNELIAIFVASVSTADRNDRLDKNSKNKRR